MIGKRSIRGKRWGLPVAFLLLSSCQASGSRSNESVSTEEPVRIVRADLPKGSLADVPTAMMPSYTKALYRLKPDRRFLFAIGEIPRLLSDAQKSEVKLVFAGGRWSISCGNSPVGTLSERPTFAEAEALVIDWAKRYPNAEHTGSDTGPPTRPEHSSFWVHELLGSLAEAEKSWKASHDYRALEIAARDFILLQLQTFDRLDLSDVNAGRAIASLAIVRSRAADSLARERALLMDLLGYRVEAAAAGQTLPAGDPIRLYLIGDGEGLRQAAAAKPSEPLAHYLLLIQTAERTSFSEWVRDSTRFPESPAIRASLLRAGLEMTDFSAKGQIPNLYRQAIVTSLGREAPQDPRDPLLTEFEPALDVRASSLTGPLLDRVTLDGHYRAGFYSSLYATAAFLLDSLSSSPAARDFAASLGKPVHQVPSELQRWIVNRASVDTGSADAAILLADIRDLHSLGPAALWRIRRTAKAYLSARVVEMRAIARPLLEAMDTRPAHLSEAASIAYNHLSDDRLRDELLAAAIRLGGGSVGDRFWLASLEGDAATLKSLVDDSTASTFDRLRALQALEESGASDPPFVRDKLAKLVQESPRELQALDRYVDFLLKSGDFPAARAALEKWLKARSERDLAFLHATTRLSEVLQRQGRLQEAWKVIEPETGSLKGDVLAQAVSVLQALGRTADAKSFAEKSLERYPSSGDAIGDLAEILWRQGDDEGAARLIRDSSRHLTTTDWFESIGPAFASVFAKAPERAPGAFRALVEVKIDPERFSAITKSLDDAGHTDLAVQLSESAPVSGPARVWHLLGIYRLVKKSKPPQAAVAWLKERIPSEFLDGASVSIYFREDYDLLWDLIPDRPDPAKNDMLYLFRAAALIRQKATTGERWQQAVTYFASRPSTEPLAVYGRFLTGLESEEKLLSSAKDMNGRCSAAYFLGLKKASEGRYHEALDWLQAGLETGEGQVPPYNMTMSLLAGWSRAKKSFNRTAAAGLL